MKKIFTAALAILIAGLMGCTIAANNPGRTDTPPAPNRRNLQPQLANANIDLEDVIPVIPPDTIPAVLPDQATQIMVTASEAEANGIKPSERVLGVTINGSHHAYPIPFMSKHEIVNTEIGGRLVAITW